MFRKESEERRDSHDGESAQGERGCRKRHRFGKPAHFAQILGVYIMFHNTGAEEQSAFRDAVGQNVHQASDETDFRAARKTQQNKRQLADCGVGQNAFDVFLAESHARAVQRADRGNDRDNCRKCVIDLERHNEKSGVSVNADFHQHGRMQKRGHRRRRDARIRKPAVKRESCGFGKDSEENEHHCPRGNDDSLHRGKVKRAGLAVNPQESDQHEQRAENGNEKCLVGASDCDILPVKTDQTVAAQRGNFPKRIDENKIGRIHKSHHGPHEEADHQIIFILALIFLDITVRVEDNKAAHKRRRHRHKQRESISVKTKAHSERQIKMHGERMTAQRAWQSQDRARQSGHDK